jgi:hypothetical protein
MRAVFLLAVLVCGCLGSSVSERYVCSDGWLAESPAACAGHNPVCQNCTCPKCPACKPETKCAPCAGALQEPATPAQDDSCARLGCPAGTRYVSSKSSGKYHACDCRFAEVLSAKNLICYGSSQEAEAAGKQPCGICVG